MTTTYEPTTTLPTLDEVYDAVLWAVCARCDAANHDMSMHKDAVEPVIVELMERGWLVVTPTEATS